MGDPRKDALGDVLSPLDVFGGSVGVAARALAAAVARGLAAAARALSKAAKVGKAANKTSTKIDYITKPGSKITNIKTNVPKSEFEKNLAGSGFTKSTSKDGVVNVFTKGDKKVTTREFSKSTNGPTAEVFMNNRPTSKIRLEDE